MILDTRTREGGSMAMGEEEVIFSESEAGSATEDKPKTATKKSSKVEEVSDDSVNVEDIPF